MDNERYDQDDLIWDQEPFLDDLPEDPMEPAQEDDFLDNEFPWFGNQTSQSSPPPPPRNGGQQRSHQGRPRSGGQARRDPYRTDHYRNDPYRGDPYYGGQRPRSGTSKKRRRKKRRSTAKTVLTVLLIVVLCILAAGGFYYRHIMNKINFDDHQSGVPTQEESVKKVDKLTNILLVGEDSRSEEETGQRSDSMILCTLNPDTHEVILTSFMRDMYVPIPGHKKNRINTAFSKGGVELLEQTIEENFGVRIDGYVSIDFSGFIEAVASLGDMQIELTEEEAEYMNEHPEFGWADENAVWHLKPGWNTLDSWQFLCYARMRHLGNSDFDRTERQRKVLMTCYQQVKNCSVPKLLSLIDNVAPYITTDIRGADLLSYAYMMASDGVTNIESNRIPADGTYKMQNVNGMDVLVPDLEQNKAILQEYINNTRSNADEAEAEEDGSEHMGVVESNPVAGD